MNQMIIQADGIFGIVAGLPLHPLVVHAAVVLVPLVALSALVMSYLPSFSRRYGKAILVLAVIAQGSLFLAKASGEALQELVDKNIESHAELGELAPFVTLPMLALIFIRWRMDRSGATVGNVWLRRGVSVGLVVASIAAIVMTVLVGHSGADSVWGWLAN